MVRSYTKRVAFPREKSNDGVVGEEKKLSNRRLERVKVKDLLCIKASPA